MPDIETKLRAVYGELPPSQRAAADYILRHLREVPSLSVTEFAERAGVSDTSVIRLCMRLGCSGYGDFRRAAASETYYGRPMDAKLADTSPESDVFAAMLHGDAENLLQTIRLTGNAEAFQRLAVKLAGTPRVWTLGFRTSAVFAEFASVSLRQSFREVRTLTPELGCYVDELPNIAPADFVLAFSFSRYTAMPVRMLRALRERGVPIGLVTDCGQSPAREFADTVFACATTSSSFVDSYAAVISVIQALAAAAAQLCRGETRESLREREKLLREFETF